MPGLVGERKKADFKSARSKDAAPTAGKSKSKTKTPAEKEREESRESEKEKKIPSSIFSFDVDDDEDDDDDIIQDSIRDSKNGSGRDPKVYVIGILAVVVVIAVIVIFGMSRRKEPEVVVTPVEEVVVPDPTPTELDPAEGLGTQNFLDNTTMTSSSEMTDPSRFTKDIYGLTTRVDYTVKQIQSVTDFVSYTKYRGTWGGGIELYYLDVEYKGTKYVIQVPFVYYKELDEKGIVPVKMEVLRIQGSTTDEILTVISYMTLDAETLQSVLDSQSGTSKR